jgi:hypothetical protein
MLRMGDKCKIFQIVLFLRIRAKKLGFSILKVDNSKVLNDISHEFAFLFSRGIVPK